MSAANEKSRCLAQEYVAQIERMAGSPMEKDLKRIAMNAYETAYLQGSADAIEDFLATCVTQTDALIARIAVLEAERHPAAGQRECEGIHGRIQEEKTS